MNIRKTVMIMVCLCLCAGARAQAFYVDALKGSDAAKGTEDEPLQSLQKAVSIANQSTAAVTIKVAPGLYILHDALRIESPKGDTAKYIVEATVMPDDKDWKPWLMPVIGSVSPNNDHKYFDHCAGIMAERANVLIHGLKFIGNPNPAVEYYYPIIRDTLTLKNLDISQCYFIGDPNGGVVQGAIYAEGPGIHVDHCIFYGCKNDVLVFENISDFSITHTIMYGAYECAVWYGYKDSDQPFVFADNVVSHCNFVWAGSKDIDHSSYAFSHSMISANDNYVGMQNGKGGVMPLAAKAYFTETNIQKSGKVKLVEVKTEGFPPDWLNLAKDSDGKSTGAGIFKTIKN
jgi:hypothetical protein